MNSNATALNASGPAPLPAVRSFSQAGILWCVAVVAVLALQSVLVLRQQPGLDEWQALEIALQSPNLTGLFENLRYEGHPPLWYWLLQTAHLVVPSGWVLRFIQLPIALAIQIQILARLPFSRLERLLFACSFAVLIDYGMMARGLGLGVMLTLAAFTIRERRLVWVPLILLPMTDFLFGCLSVICIAILWREKRLWLPGLAFWLAAGLFSAWCVRPAQDMIPALSPHGAVEDIITELARFGTVFVPLQLKAWTPMWNGLAPFEIAIPASFLFFGMGILLLRIDRFAMSLFMVFCALIMIFSVTAYPLATRHVSLAGLLLVLLIARVRKQNSAPTSPIFRAWLIVAAACGLFASTVVLARPFHAARQAADYIEANGLATKHWASFPDSRGEGVSGLLGTRFERLEVNCMQSFVRWNYRSKIETMRQLEAELQRVARRGGGYYLLSDIRLHSGPLAHPNDYQLLTLIPAGYDGEPFYLYRIRPDLPATAAEPPPCVPN